MALACDLIVVAQDAQFRMAEVSLGLVPDLGGTARLVRSVGYQRALEICATGRSCQSRGSGADRPRAGLRSGRRTGRRGRRPHRGTAGGSPPDAVRAITALMAATQVNSPVEQLAAERFGSVGLIRRLAGTAGPGN